MGTKNYNNYSDMITFSRASSGTALAKISYGAELVTNGTFDTDLTGWGAHSGDGSSAWSSGTLLFSGVTNATRSQNITLPAGDTFICTFTLTGNGRVQLGGQIQGFLPVSSGETYTFIATSDGTNQIYLQAFADGTSFDNVSVRKILFDQPDGTLQLFNHPANQPRVEYDYQGNRLGLLVEEARTNTIGDSNVFLSDIGTAVSSSAETCPDGTTTATQVVTSGASTHRIRRTTGAVTTTGVAYAYSVFVKSDEVSYIQLLNGGDANYFANFDLVNETVGATGAATTGTITKYPNGWYRITALYDGTGSYTTTGYIYAAASASAPYGQGANTPGLTFHLFGAQNEAGTFPTSYIPTSGATATRSADVASIGVGAFGYNKGAGSVLVVADTISTSADNHQDFRLTGSVGGNSVNSGSRVGSGSAGQYTTWIQGGGSTVALLTVNNTVSDGAQYKALYRFAENDFALSVSGGSVVSDTAGAMPVSINTLNLGYGYGYLNGHISSIAYYPRRLTDAQIQKLTQVKAVPTLSLTFDGNSDSYLETSIHG